MKMNNTKFGQNGELLAKRILRKHFSNIRRQKHLAPFDYIAKDKLTSEDVAIEVKTTSKENGKLAHIESQAMDRKLRFLNETNRKGILLLIISNGKTKFYLSKLSQHVSKGMLIEIT